jgi:hypothetical protein
MTTTAESLIRKARSKRQRKLFYSRARCLLMGALIAALAVLALMPHAAHPTKIWEDDPRWDCRTMGNHECWPGNSNGVAPGVYDQDGVKVETWQQFVQRVKAADDAIVD